MTSNQIQYQQMLRQQRADEEQARHNLESEKANLLSAQGAYKRGAAAEREVFRKHINDAFNLGKDMVDALTTDVNEASKFISSIGSIL